MEPSGSEKVVASLPSVGEVTKISRTPKRARGLSVGTSPRRSPRLQEKCRRLLSDPNACSSQCASSDLPSTKIFTPTREALKSKLDMDRDDRLSEVKRAVVDLSLQTRCLTMWSFAKRQK